VASVHARANELIGRERSAEIAELTPHTMRRTFASLLAELGISPRRAMYLLGHTDPKLTMRVYQQGAGHGRWRRRAAREGPRLQRRGGLRDALRTGSFRTEAGPGVVRGRRRANKDATWRARKCSVERRTRKRLMGFEPTTFCMASRRSSQLSYSRAARDYSPGPSSTRRMARSARVGVRAESASLRLAPRRRGGVATQRPAKPFTPVRFRSAPCDRPPGPERFYAVGSGKSPCRHRRGGRLVRAASGACG
jgi:Phage integrase family